MKGQKKQDTQKKSQSSYYDIISKADEKCLKLGQGKRYIECVDDYMKKHGIDKKTRQYILKDELLGYDI